MQRSFCSMASSNLSEKNLMNISVLLAYSSSAQAARTWRRCEAWECWRSSRWPTARRGCRRSRRAPPTLWTRQIENSSAPFSKTRRHFFRRFCRHFSEERPTEFRRVRKSRFAASLWRLLSSTTSSTPRVRRRLRDQTDGFHRSVSPAEGGNSFDALTSSRSKTSAVEEGLRHLRRPRHRHRRRRRSCIFRESRRSLSERLPEIRAWLPASAPGRSGAGSSAPRCCPAASPGSNPSRRRPTRSSEPGHRLPVSSWGCWSSTFLHPPHPDAVAGPTCLRRSGSSRILKKQGHGFESLVRWTAGILKT